MGQSGCWRNRRAGDGSAGVLQADADRMIREAATRRRTAMKHYVGLDVSLK
jgi:hypothetical protein